MAGTPGTAYGLPQLAGLYDPTVAADQTALDRQMALAQALRAQSMAPVSTQGRQIGNVGYAVSPWEGIAKLAQAYAANKMDEKNDQGRIAFAQKMAQALKDMDNPPGQAQPPADGAIPGNPGAGGLPISTPDAPVLNVPQSQPTGTSASPRNFSLANLLRGAVVNDVGGPAMGAAYAKQFEPTDFEKTLRAAGVAPNSLEARRLWDQYMFKQTNVPSEAKRPGGYDKNPMNGEITQYPQVPPGFQAVSDGRGGFTLRPLTGGAEAIATGEEAKGVGAARVKQAPPAYDANGNPLPVQSEAARLGYGPSPLQTGAQVPPDVQASRDDGRRNILMTERADAVAKGDAQAVSDIDKELGALKNGQAYPTRSASYPAQPLGTENAQKALDTSWEGLKAANREAQNMSSYLDNIQTAAEKGAIVGPGAERREMIQGFLQLAGVKEDVNTNATTQTQLLNKYSNQIVTRLGQGGLGTDAARAMLASAYPGQPMNVDAIREAVANLKGAQSMVQAKARLLQEPAIKRDTTTYQTRELAFDQAADPRIWQYKSMTDPAKRSAFAKQVLQQDPTFPARIKKLEDLGAL